MRRQERPALSPPSPLPAQAAWARAYQPPERFLAAAVDFMVSSRLRRGRAGREALGDHLPFVLTPTKAAGGCRPALRQAPQHPTFAIVSILALVDTVVEPRKRAIAVLQPPRQGRTDSVPAALQPRSQPDRNGLAKLKSFCAPGPSEPSTPSGKPSDKSATCSTLTNAKTASPPPGLD